MSLHPRYVPDIPDETARVAKAVFRKGNPYMKMRDELGTFFTDDQFTDLYPNDGQPAFSPWRLALVCILQFAENLTDRQAADAVEPARTAVHARRLREVRRTRLLGVGGRSYARGAVALSGLDVK